MTIVQLFEHFKNAKLLYTELELLAEFGGYVGLFLGFFVFKISQVVKTHNQKMNSLIPIFICIIG